jgi:hypothetical protein
MTKKGRQRRQYDESIPVNWFRARGDFDPKIWKGADNDTDAIQAALDVAKRIEIPYTFHSTNTKSSPL